MEGNSTQLTLAVAALGADAEDRAELTRRLKQQLIDAEVESVQFACLEPLPAGAKGDPLSLSALAVTVAPAAITAVIGVLQVWLSRHDRASVTVESGGEKFTISGTPSTEQKQMVEAFLKRHKT